MTDEPRATGIVEAVVFDALLELGADVDESLRFSHEQRMDLLRPAESEGRLPPELARRLQAFGLLADDPPSN